MSAFMDLIKKFDPNKDAGGTLLALNVIGMIFAAASNTVAAAKDKNTSPEDKKFLVPAGTLTGVANIGIYFSMTRKIIKKLKDVATNVVNQMDEKTIVDNTTQMVNKSIKKAEGGLFNTGLFKKTPEHVASMKATLLKDNKVTDYAKNLYKTNVKEGAGVLGAFAGAVIGCSILTPVIRDVSAYFVQKRMEKGNPDMQNAPYRPYFDPAHIQSARFKKVGKQPLSMKSYMTFTNAKMANGKMKI